MSQPGPEPRDRGPAPLFQLIAGRFDSLRRSEQKVARTVLADPPLSMRLSLAELAQRAEVSTPTVMRLCTALGFAGFADFKLALAQSVALGVPATQSAIGLDDPLPVIAERIFDFSLTSLDHARRHLDLDVVERAVASLALATQIVFVGVGASQVVAQDAAGKASLFGVPCAAPADIHQQIMLASLAGPTACLVAISNTGRTATVIDAVECAAANHTTTIGLTSPGTPLARCVDIAIQVESLENTDLFTPTISRLTHLAIVDLLATAVALRNYTEERSRRFHAALDRVAGTRSAAGAGQAVGSGAVIDDTADVGSAE